MDLEIFMQLLCFCWSCISANLSTICPFDFLCSLLLVWFEGLFLPNKHRIKLFQIGKVQFGNEFDCVKKAYSVYVQQRDNLGYDH